ncbi:subtilisin-like protease SBT4.5 [Arabidopsis lyrata subsp. lyrata]|uniref:subtilisin-like protease SBT4.5 n=1 Tax=Arabidopsis lyrata subsp. lyrata TaxID=81972 RepID=UPI000A29DF19|nr:subtilisin-like protease SBT4.5 [Arabidopsis lyrata subsp. lyrata]|eukprot:XP_020881849.1 subtilisin-like protease SBT4.5 [Arabidopsis lyrata subsp. lyrata]
MVGLPFEEDPIAIGAFHVMAKGILIVNSAGNSGPQPSTVSSTSPWIFTIAASNTNRAFVTKVVLGDGKTIVGRSVNFHLNGIKYPLVYGGSSSSRCDAASTGFCSPGCLDSKRVKGKIVLCDSPQNPKEAQVMGAIASIVRSRHADVASRTKILAVYSLDAPPSQSDTRRVNYSVLGGTSMSCVAAYLKTFHPRRSPSMIQSAIMSTARPMNTSTSPFDHMAEFAYGAGHVNPIADWSMNYTAKSLRLISGENRSCSEEQSQSLAINLNYPSMTVKVRETKPFNLNFRRTVTNVGMAKSTYKAQVLGSELTIRVVPDFLSLKSMYQMRSFTVTVSGQGPEADKLASAHLI